MHSNLFIAGLAVLMLSAALALPINLDDVQETAETDEQLLKMLGGHSMEAEEHGRERRTPIQDPELALSTAHADELAHEHLGHKQAGRERRAVGEDSSASSEEIGQAVPAGQEEQQKEEKADSTSEEANDPKQEKEQKQDNAASSSEEHTQARRRRAAGEDSSGSSEETGQAQQQKKEKDDSSSEEAKQEQQPESSVGSSADKPKERKRRAIGEDSNGSSSSEEEKETGASARRKREANNDIGSSSLEADQIDSAAIMEEIAELNDQLNMEDYAQGCEVLEVNSNEANNETTYVE